MIMNSSKKIKVSSFSYFRKNKAAWISCYILLVWLCIALLAPVLSNEQPLYVKYKGHSYFPAFSFSNTIVLKSEEKQETLLLNQVDWSRMNPEKIIYAPVPYSPGKSNP